MIEFLHTADWHLGNSFSLFTKEENRELNTARLRAIKELFIYANKLRIPLILCAGDQIDRGELRDKEELLNLFEVIREYSEIKVVMIAGNHDPFLPGNIYERINESSFPPNLHLVTNREIIALPGIGVKIAASSLQGKYGRENPL
ncbi:MAG: metallophosphoesterase, partial [Spirochaetota bacterium]